MRTGKAKKGASKAPKWVNRIVGHGEVSAVELIAHPSNPRIHPDTQRSALAEALTRIGWIDSVIVNKTTNRILNGHLRVELAAARGESVPVQFVELSEADERLALASFDPLGELAIEDSEKLGDLLAALDLGDSPLDTLLSTAMQDAQLTRLLEGEDGGEMAVTGSRAPHLAQNITVVIPMDDLALFEKAIRETGELNRGKAIAEICAAYLNRKVEIEAV